MKSFLIIGLGKFGRHMAEKLIENGHEVMAIDYDEKRADELVGTIREIVIGDVTEERFMASIGVENFDVAVVAIGDDFQTVLEATVLLKDLGSPYVIARASADVHKKLLLRNGADYVVYAEREMAERLAVRFGANNVFEYVELTPEIGIYEIPVPQKWQGKTMVELAIRNKYHVSILATKKGDAIFPLPNPKHVFEASENIMVMGTGKDIHVITNL